MSKKKPNNEQLIQLARDIRANKVFTSWQIKDKSYLPSIFMPLMFVGKSAFNNGLFYEYLDSRDMSPRTISGYPIFGTVRALNKKDSSKLWDILQKLNKNEEDFVKTLPEYP
jgi:hypothetical protein|tara:strand:+ start:278 stop:613 length:336 start_codon:yes stop_codon:yes gene_type:complete